MSVSRNTIYNVAGSLAPSVLGLVTVPLYLRLIGPERYGVLSIAWLLLGYFGLFDLGLGRATSFRIAALRDKPAQARADAFWAALIVNIGLGAVGAVALYAAANYFFAHAFKVEARLRPEITAAIPLLALSVPVATLSGVLTGALQGREKFLATSSVSAISTALFQIFPLMLGYAFGAHLVLLLLGALSARAVSLCVLAFQCARELTRGTSRRFVRSEVRQLLGFGGWVTLTSMFGPILFMLDRFVIGATLGARAVAVYSVPLQITRQFSVLPNSLAGALFPRMSASDRQDRWALAGTATKTLACLMTLPVLCAIFLIGPFLHVWVGAAIGDAAAPIGRCVLVGVWANAFALMPFTTLQASGRPDLVSKAILAEIPAYVAGLYLCIHFFGLTGAAAALAGRNILDWFVMCWFAGRRFDSAGLLATNLLALVAAACLAGHCSITQWQWWLSAFIAGSVVLVLGLRALPPAAAVWVGANLRERLGRLIAA